MKKLKIFLVVFILLAFLNVKADGCDANELKRLKEDARNLEFVYDNFTDAAGNVRFKISILNMKDDIVALVERDIYRLDFDTFKKGEDGVYYLTNYAEGEVVTITIRAYTRDNCSAERLRSKTIRLPYYNQFYDSKECKDYPEFKYCKQEFNNTEITQEKFDKELEKYKKEIAPKEGDKANILKYILIALASLAVIAAITFVTIKLVKKHRENDI